MPQRLRSLPGEFAIARLPPHAAVPDWAGDGCVTMVTRSPDELSILVGATQVPDDVRNERGWCGFVLVGPFPFSTTGVLASVLQPLALAGVPILAMSTFDTDYVFVKRDDQGRAIAAMIAAGHDVDYDA
jgi:hypothetical protein